MPSPWRQAIPACAVPNMLLFVQPFWNATAKHSISRRLDNKKNLTQRRKERKEREKKQLFFSLSLRSLRLCVRFFLLSNLREIECFAVAFQNGCTNKSMFGTAQAGIACRQGEGIFAGLTQQIAVRDQI